MLPKLIGMRVAMKNATMNGNVMLTGNDAAIWASGCATRATRGRSPIQTPIGVQINVASTLIATTRSRVSTPSDTTCSISAAPMSVRISFAISTASNASHAMPASASPQSDTRRSRRATLGA